MSRGIHISYSHTTIYVVALFDNRQNPDSLIQDTNK